MGVHVTWPLRFGPDGHIATAPEGSYPDYAAQAGLLAVTRRGERPLVPDLGVDFPTGARTVDPGVLQAECDRWIGEGRYQVTTTPVQDRHSFQEVHVHV